MINFAHGDVFMVGAFLCFAAASLAGLPFVPTLLAAMLGAAVLGVAIERLAYRPLRDAPRVSAIITALGVGIFLENFLLALNPYPRSIPQLFGDGAWSAGGLSFSSLQVLIVVVSLALMFLLDRLVHHTMLGTAMRAVSFDRAFVPLMGVPVDLVISATFAIGAGLAGAAGTLYAHGLPGDRPVHGHHGRLEGLHLGGHRRHRQRPRRHDRRRSSSAPPRSWSRPSSPRPIATSWPSPSCSCCSSRARTAFSASPGSRKYEPTRLWVLSRRAARRRSRSRFAIPAYGLVNKYQQMILMYVGINVILAASLNLVNGYMGEFSLGSAGFMAVGAYTASFVTVRCCPRRSVPWGWPPRRPAWASPSPSWPAGSWRRSSACWSRSPRSRPAATTWPW